MYYGIISGFAKLALDIENIMKMSEDVTVAYLKYTKLKGKAEVYIASIKLGMKQLSLGYFASPPHSYQLFNQPKEINYKKNREKDQENNNDPKRFKTDDTGYIVFSGTSPAKANLPKLHDGKVLCKEYVICGRNCSYKGNCRWGLHLQYRDLFHEDKEKLDKWISNSYTLK